MTHNALIKDIKEHLEYSPETGLFRWKKSGSGRQVGWFAGTPDGSGHLRVAIFGKRYQAHRLAWMIVYETSPRECLDHINGVRGDNRICNLREATHTQNVWNTDWPPGKKGLPRGVDAVGKNKFRARAMINGVMRYTTRFDSAEAAGFAYLQLVQKHRGDFCSRYPLPSHGGDLADPHSFIWLHPSSVAGTEKSTDENRKPQTT